MAIAIVTKPNKFHSGYNPVKYTLTSTNVNKLGFRFIVQIFDKGTSNKLAEFSVAPDQTDNNRGNIDISRVIQNKLDAFFTTVNFGSEDAVTAYYNYDIKFGESYVSNWNFNDYIFLTGDGIGFTTDSAYGAGFSDIPHGYSVGDQIKVSLNGTYTDNRASLNTYFVVTEVVSPTTIRVNGSFTAVGSFPTTPGKTVYADLTKVTNYNLASVTSQVAVNTALDLPELVSTQGSLASYINTSPTSEVLSNQPLKYSVTPEQFIFFNLLNLVGGSKLFIRNDSGDVFNKTLSGGGLDRVRSVGVGPSNFGTLTLLTGTLPLIKPTTKWYEVTVQDSSSSNISNTYRFNMDNRCQINDTQVMFMDRKGSFNSFAFQLKRRERGSIKRESYNKYISDYTTTQVAGNTVYHSEVDKTMTLVTNFMGEQMSFYFEELLTSRHTYVLWEGLWYSCTVQDTTFENEFERNNKLINKSIEVKLDYQNPIN